MSAKTRNILGLIINTFIFVSTMIVTIIGVAKGSSPGQLGENIVGLSYFKPYTIDSNVLNGFVSFMMLTFNIYNLIENKDELPRFLVVAQLISTVSVTVTIMTVVFFLAPMQALAGNGYIFFFKNDMFFFHLINPIVSIINFIFIDRRYKLNIRDIIIGMSSTVIYSFVYLYNVLITKNWSDFYGFTFGGKIYMAPISMIVMYLVSLLFSYLLARFNKFIP